MHLLAETENVVLTPYRQNRGGLSAKSPKNVKIVCHYRGRDAFRDASLDFRDFRDASLDSFLDSKIPELHIGIHLYRPVCLYILYICIGMYTWILCLSDFAILTIF